MKLKKYKTIFWDFDGVILDSDEVRTEGFRDIFQDFNNQQVELIVEYHKQNGGLSRYQKIDFFFDKILKKKISKDEKSKYAKAYSNFCFDKLCKPNLLIQDSIRFIVKNFRNFNFHIVSASDQLELRNVCNKLGIEKYFISIMGSPINKKTNIQNLISKNRYSKIECCLIGDSFNDKESAEENSIDFIGYNNLNLLRSTSQYVFSFTNLG